MVRTLALGTALLLATTLPALAHLAPEEHGSFAAGFSHPLFGTDHILAMVAVGLWASLLASGAGNRRALWLAPTAFVATMATGFAAALLHLPLPFVEPVILASIVVIGLFAAMALRVPTPIAMALVGFFAFFHGHAHGGELGSAGVAGFGVGFAIATALLHGLGIAAGTGFSLFGGTTGRTVARAAGALTALGGVWLVVG